MGIKSELPHSLTNQLIAYIGNKRRLLPFLRDVFSELATSSTDRGPVRFADAFSGSGAVSRLARSMGYCVAANDWEPYAFVVSAAAIEHRAWELDSLFAAQRGLAAAVAALNQIGSAAAASPGTTLDGEAYIARHFAPRVTETADYRRERLFYTAENARFLDAVREEIDRWYPKRPEAADLFADSPDARAKRLLLALLVYEASTHANTSGVFKAYHKGFGGHGQDALGRILAPMHLEVPQLPPGPVGTASKLPALEFARRTPAEVVYLDPPYATHQYGSNYFLLNTIVQWDKPAPPRGKAGIRPDWTRTRSAFCSRHRAAAAMSELADAVDARYLVVSYSNEGLIDPETLYDLLARRGRVTFLTTDYTVYRGGRQSMLRHIRNMEFVMVVSRSETAQVADRDAMAQRLAAGRVAEALQARFHPDRFVSIFGVRSGGVVLADALMATVRDGYEIVDVHGSVQNCSLRDLRGIADRLDGARCSDHAEEAMVLVGLLADAVTFRREREQRLLWCLRKFAFAKYRTQLGEAAAAVRELIAREPAAFVRLQDGLQAVLERAHARARG